MPFSPTGYVPQYGDRIAELMMRQGEIAARGAERSGMIWGRAIENLGQIAGNAVENYQQEKQAKQREAAFSEALGTWDMADPKGSILRIARVTGPEDAMKFGSGMMSLEGLIQKNQKGEIPSLEELKAGVVASHVLYKNAPGMFAQQYPMLREHLGPAFKAHLGVDLPETPTPEIEQGLGKLAQEWGTKQEGGFTLGAGQVRYGADGQQIASGPPVTEKPAQPRVVGRSLVDDKGQVIYRDPEGAGARPKMYEVELPGPNGTLIKKVVSEDEMRRGVEVAPKSVGNKPVTGAERQALSFYNRAKEATDGIEELENRVSGQGVIAQQYNKTAPNWLKSDDQQLYEQRQRSFTEARLRKESGAAIPESEFENDRKTYWIQPGDSEATKNRKREARATLLKGLAYSSGKAYEEFYGEPAPRGSGATAPTKEVTGKVGRFTVQVEP